jgi:hypothetical protein
MKKLILLSIVLNLSVFMNAQVFVFEDFSNATMPPTDWSIDGFEEEWRIQDYGWALGEGPEEAGFSDYGTASGSTKLISSIIDLSGFTSVTFVFKHHFHYGGGAAPLIGVATKSGTNDWTSAWEISPTTDITSEETIVISNSDVGQTDFQFCFYWDGTFSVSSWSIDDIMLHSDVLNIDGSIKNILTPTFVSIPEVVSATFINFGNSEVTSFETSWQVDDGEITTTTIDNVTLGFIEKYTFDCDGEINNLNVGDHNLKVWVTSVNGMNDEYPDNNLMEKNISIVSRIIPRKPFFEMFTSST